MKPPSTPEEPSTPTKAAHPALVIAVLCLCGTLAALQQTLIVPLLPEFPHLLSTTVDNASWLVTATLLTGAVATPVVSRLADMFGKRLMMISCLVVLIAGSTLGALTDTLASAIAARALQGIAMALIPVGISIMRDELPRDRVPAAVALMSATLAIGAGAGLPLSGLIAERMDWHAIFWVTAAAGAVMLVAVLLVVSESPIRTRGAFDYTGAILLSGALTALLLTLSKGGQWGWTSRLTLGLTIASVLLLAIWFFLELRVSNPIVDLRVARRPAVLLVNIASVLVGFAMFANMLVTVQLLQLPPSTGYGLGLDVIQAGLWMMPTALSMAVLAPLSAAITRRFGAGVTLIIGSLIMAFGYVGRVFLPVELTHIVLGATIVSIGTALAYAAMPTLIMRAVPVTETASANGLNTLLRSIGTSMASSAIAAVATTMTMHVSGVTLPSLAAFLIVFWIAAAASLLAAVVVLPVSWATAQDVEDGEGAADPPVGGDSPGGASPDVVTVADMAATVEEIESRSSHPAMPDVPDQAPVEDASKAGRRTP